MACRKWRRWQAHDTSSSAGGGKAAVSAGGGLGGSVAGAITGCCVNPALRHGACAMAKYR